MFPSTLPGQDLKPTPLWMEAEISTQSAQASIEKNTVPCIPAGPKSCLVRKMAWSWYSACSGSRRCCVLAHRHTCSRLRDGLPRSIRLIDCTETTSGRRILKLKLQIKCNFWLNYLPRSTTLAKVKEKGNYRSLLLPKNHQGYWRPLVLLKYSWWWQKI